MQHFLQLVSQRWRQHCVASCSGDVTRSQLLLRLATSFVRETTSFVRETAWLIRESSTCAKCLLPGSRLSIWAMADANRRRKAKSILMFLELDRELEEEIQKKKRQRNTWTTPWGARREEKGCFHQVNNSTRSRNYKQLIQCHTSVISPIALLDLVFILVSCWACAWRWVFLPRFLPPKQKAISVHRRCYWSLRSKARYGHEGQHKTRRKTRHCPAISGYWRVLSVSPLPVSCRPHFNRRNRDRSLFGNYRCSWTGIPEDPMHHGTVATNFWRLCFPLEFSKWYWCHWWQEDKHSAATKCRLPLFWLQG